MLRTQISLTEEDRRLLDEVAARTGRSIAFLIREAISATYGPGRSSEEDLAVMRQAFGSWRGRQVDGARYVERLRRGQRLPGQPRP